MLHIIFYGLLISSTVASLQCMEKEYSSYQITTWPCGEKQLSHSVEELSADIKEQSFNNQEMLDALRQWNHKKLHSIVSHVHFNSSTNIETSIGKLDALTYLMLYQNKREKIKKFTKCIIILINAGVTIKEPSENNGFSVFGLAKTGNIFNLLVDLSNNQNHCLDMYLSQYQCTLFQHLCCSTMPKIELQELYYKYAPSLDFPMLAGGNIAHSLLAYFLSLNLMRYVHAHTTYTEKEAVLYFEDVGTKNIDAILEKIAFFTEKNVDLLWQNEYKQTVYSFYFSLLNGLYKDDRTLFPLNQPAIQPLVDHLFDIKDTIEKMNKTLTLFFEVSLLLAKRLFKIYPYITDQEPTLMRIKKMPIPSDILLQNCSLADTLNMYKKEQN